MRLRLLSLIAVSALGAFSHASFYQYDDGSFETNLSTSGPETYTALFLTHFVVASGWETLTSIDIVWGSSTVPNLPNGLNVQVFLMDDPNGDGNPDDASVVQSISATTVNSGMDVFTNYALAPVTYSPGTSFFAGALLFDVPNGSSWVAIDTSATGRSADNWWNVLVSSPVGTHNPLSIFGSPDWTFPVRVNAEPVPEPATFVVLGAATLALLRRRARK